MIFDHRTFTLSTLIFTLALSVSTSSFCSNLTSASDQNTACFLEPSTHNPVVLRTSGNSLVLPCHVARSKRAVVEWWYVDPQNLINIKIYPVFPAVRPTVLRFVTSLPTSSKSLNESDVVDASILLRHVNIDDSGTYRCVIRPWTSDPLVNFEEILFNDDSDLVALAYQVQITAPRLCQASPGTLPCFSGMRLSSPGVVDAYQTSFLQCVVNNFNRPVNVFWVVGNVSSNSVLITDYLTSNQYRGDRLRRVFPLSAFDFSIELIVNRTTQERIYSCVIDGATDMETTLFTYIVRTIEPEAIAGQNNNSSGSVDAQETKKIVAHDALIPEQIDSLREQHKMSVVNPTTEHSQSMESTSESSWEESTASHSSRSSEDSEETSTNI